MLRTAPDGARLPLRKGPPVSDDFDWDDDEYRFPYAPKYLPGRVEGAIPCILHNAECVRKSVAMSVGTIRSLSQES